jgi:predicted GIY-YIG superfamily endonuclease
MLFTYGVKRKSHTKEECKEVALNYDNITDFTKYSKKFYMRAWRMGWLDEICSHMKRCYNNWSKKECAEKALLCSYKKEFYKEYKKYYEHALKNGWLDELCSHMIEVGSRYKRCIYVWEFEDNSAYIGLTYNIKERIKQHKNSERSVVYKHLKLFQGECKQLTGYIDVNESKILEKYWVENYKNKKWKILNTGTIGLVGNNLSKYNENDIIEYSKIYNNRTIFRKKHSGAYKFAKRNLLLDKYFLK